MIVFNVDTEEERVEKGYCYGCFGCRVPCGKNKPKEIGKHQPEQHQKTQAG